METIELLRAIFSPKNLAIIMVFSIPLSVIISIYKYKLQKLKLQGAKESISKEDIGLLKEALAQNNELQERVKNLETIITSLDSEILSLKAQDDAIRIRQIASQLTK
jgi:hypothetical protein